MADEKTILLFDLQRQLILKNRVFSKAVRDGKKAKELAIIYAEIREIYEKIAKLKNEDPDSADAP